MPIGIALGVTGAVTAASSAYGSKKAGDVNKKSLEASERSDVTAAAIEREKMAADDRRWNDYLRVHEPIWGMGQQTLGTLYDLAGYKGGGPSMAAPQRPAPGPPGDSPSVPPGARPRPGAPVSRGRTLYDLTRQPATMPMPQGGGGQTLTDLMNMVSTARQFGGRQPPPPTGTVPPLLARPR